MRNLTQQEIDQAPEWATHYIIESVGDDSVIYESETLCWWDEAGMPPLPNRLSDHAKPIPRKKFMEPYKHWCDPIFDNTDDVGDCYYDLIFREKAIEIAKHFKLTAEDLK